MTTTGADRAGRAGDRRGVAAAKRHAGDARNGATPWAAPRGQVAPDSARDAALAALGVAGRGPGRRSGWGWEGPGMPPVPPPDFGPGFGRKRGFGAGRGHRRARRGDVRGAILDLLAEGQPWNGYQIIQEIANRTNGIWRPSAGSVYPALQLLEDEGLISPEGEGRRRMYTLTAEGRAYAEAHGEELRASWDAVAGMTDDAALELGNMIRQIMMAVMEVRRAGSPGQLAEARRVLAETRRSLYRILADDIEDDDADAGDASAAPGGEQGGE